MNRSDLNDAADDVARTPSSSMPTRERAAARPAAGAAPPAPARDHAHWQVLPDDADLERVAHACRQRVRQQALLAAGVSVLPVPGLDWLTDVGVLGTLVPEINEAFGLSEQQIQQLAPTRQLEIYQAISAAGGILVGKLMTRGLLVQALRRVGVRLTAQQASRWVPIAGQAISAVLTYTALKIVCEMHIRQCMDAFRALRARDGRALRPVELAG